MRIKSINYKDASQIVRRNITGQGMTEYIIIVALIAIAAVGAVRIFGGSVQAQFASLSEELLGADGDAKRAAAVAESAGFVSTAKGLDNYSQ